MARILTVIQLISEYEQPFIMNSCSDKNVSKFSFKKMLECPNTKGHLGNIKSGQQAPKRSEGHLLAVAQKAVTFRDVENE